MLAVKTQNPKRWRAAFLIAGAVLFSLAKAGVVPVEYATMCQEIAAALGFTGAVTLEGKPPAES